jgi:hypothetical protein
MLVDALVGWLFAMHSRGGKQERINQHTNIILSLMHALVGAVGSYLLGLKQHPAAPRQVSKPKNIILYYIILLSLMRVIIHTCIRIQQKKNSKSV